MPNVIVIMELPQRHRHRQDPFCALTQFHTLTMKLGVILGCFTNY